MPGSSLEAIPVAVAFVAGLLSFLSPCLLPLVPAYLTYLSGVSIASLEEIRRARIRIFTHALLFVLGFTLIYVLLGLSAGALGRLFIIYRILFDRVAGTVIILFGLYMLGVFRFISLSYAKQFDLGGVRMTGYLGSFVVGVAFSFTNLACVGPILGSILLLAGTGGKAGIGAFLLAIYSLGLGIPFLVSALGVGFFSPYISRMGRFLGILQKVSGFLLILFGILVFTGVMTLIMGRLVTLFF
jgi:cytochrome c-type biogenesis protein